MFLIIYFEFRHKNAKNIFHVIKLSKKNLNNMKHICQPFNLKKLQVCIHCCKKIKEGVNFPYSNETRNKYTSLDTGSTKGK